MSNEELQMKCKRLQKELKQCRNELCIKCGEYHEAHRPYSACSTCRYRHNGEWQKDIEKVGYE